MPSDWKDNGVFMEFMKDQMVENVNKDFINRNDGLSKTLLVMESLTAGTWDDGNRELLSGIVWPHGGTDHMKVNDPVVVKNLAETRQGIISSKHSRGANAVFCDGHTLFLSEGIDPAVLDLVMTPNGKRVKEPGSTNVVGQPGNFREFDLLGE